MNKKIITIFLTCLFINFPAKAEPPHSTEIFGSLDFQDKKITGSVKKNDFKNLEDLNVYTGSSSGKGLELSDKEYDDVKRIVYNCHEYMSLKAKGWYALSPKDRAIESWFIKTCPVINLLKKSQNSKNSNFSTVEYELNKLNLSADLVQDIYMEPCSIDQSVEDCLTSNKGNYKLHENQIILETKDATTTYSLTAKGDFNNDGWEDILLNYRNSFKENNFRSYGNICLEWKEGQEKPTLFDCTSNQ